MKNKVLIIGNGPCIFDSYRGKEIDDFEGRIIRINGYKIEGYEKHIGTKTDIFVIGQLDLKEQLQLQYDYILLYLSGLDGGRGLKRLQEISPHNEIKLFPMKEIKKLKELLLLSKRIAPTTGLIAIHWFMRSDIDLYIHGFDFYETGHNYFSNDRNPDHSKCHNSIKEKIYIEYLVEQNIVKWF